MSQSRGYYDIPLTVNLRIQFMKNNDKRNHKIKILLVDDHPVVRIGIRSMLEENADLQVVGEAMNGRQGIEFFTKYSPDVVVLDMDLPDMSGLEVLKRIKQEAENIPILALSAHDEDEYINALIDGGLSGYVVKEEAPEILVNAVRAVANGEKGWISRKIMECMTNRSKEKEDFKRFGLTRREYQVLTIIAKGKTNQEIAYDLGISEKTVERHIQGVYSKMGVVSRVEAAVTYIRSGMQ
jgi:DNA-binding NarL/FixJ family response regulator